MSFSEGHAVAPAIKTCGICGQQNIDIRRRSTFGLAEDGRLICPRCVASEHERFEALSLFTPAPTQIAGQMSM